MIRLKCKYINTNFINVENDMECVFLEILENIPMKKGNSFGI